MNKLLLAAVLIGGIYWYTNRKNSNSDTPQVADSDFEKPKDITVKNNGKQITLEVVQVDLPTNIGFLQVVEQFDSRIVIGSDGVRCYVKNKQVALATDEFIAGYIKESNLPGVSINYALWEFVVNSKRPSLIFSV